MSLKMFKRALFKLPKRSITEIFPGIEKGSARLCLAHIPNRPDMVMPLKETLVIATICQWLQPRRAFEIGTFTGTTTLALAMNSPEDAKIFTLDLPAAEKAGSENQLGAVFRGTAFQEKITQLQGDSASFDFQPYHATIDLMLVDGNHRYEFVKADTANALKMIRPGGVIIWDDYLWDKKYPECAGVTRCLDELADDYGMVNIADTRLAVSRR